MKRGDRNLEANCLTIFQIEADTYITGLGRGDDAKSCSAIDGRNS